MLIKSCLAFLLMLLLTVLTACGGGGGSSGSGGSGGGGVSLTVSINPNDGIALTQSATLSWSSDGTSATLITKEVATVQAQNSEVKQDNKPRIIYKKEADGRVRITHIFYEDDLKEIEQKATTVNAVGETIATATLPPSGSMQVSPTKTTTYTIRATGPNGSAEKSVTLTVIPHTPDELVIIYNSSGIKGQKPIRWGNGIVEVYDATGYSRLQEALDAWNQAIGGPMTLKKSMNPNAPLKIRYDAAYIEQFFGNNTTVCAVATLEPPDNDFRIVGANIRFHPNRCVGSHAVMMHEIGHAIGFLLHTNNGGIMDATVYTDKIDALARIMINRLYQLPIGVPIPF